MPRTVVIVDDEAKIRGLVRSYLEREGYTVLEAGTGARALELAPGADLMILDLRLPDRAGEDVARRVGRGGMPIIMLTAKASEVQRVAGLQLGADDYVTKPFSPRELVARVDAVLRRSGGESEQDDGSVSFGGALLRIDGERREVWVGESSVSLTRTEFDLLSTLAARPGRVWSRFELVSRVHGDDRDASERTVDVHVKNLRRKLGDPGTAPRLVATVPGIGYKLAVDRDA